MIYNTEHLDPHRPLVRKRLSEPKYLNVDSDDFVAWSGTNELLTKWGYTVSYSREIADVFLYKRSHVLEWEDRDKFDLYCRVVVCQNTFFCVNACGETPNLNACWAIVQTTGYDMFREGMYHLAADDCEPAISHTNGIAYYCLRDVLAKAKCSRCGKRRMSPGARYCRKLKRGFCSEECLFSELEEQWLKKEREKQTLDSLKQLMGKSRRAMRKRDQGALRSLKKEFARLANSLK